MERGQEEGEEWEEPSASALSSVSSIPYNCQELILFGSIFENALEDLKRRLSGLCDPGVFEFQEHEMVFSLKLPGTESDVTVRLRRKFGAKDLHGGAQAHQWHFRYIGSPEPVQNCPVIVRKVIDSSTLSVDMMEFVKSLGLRMDYEFIVRGWLFTAGPIKVVISRLLKTEKTGVYDQIKKLGESLLVEMSICLPESADYLPASKQLRDLADQLSPLVDMKKIDYWRK